MSLEQQLAEIQSVPPSRVHREESGEIWIADDLNDHRIIRVENNFAAPLTKRTYSQAFEQGMAMRNDNHGDSGIGRNLVVFAEAAGMVREKAFGIMRYSGKVSGNMLQ